MNREKEYIEKGDVFDIVASQYCASSDETEEALGNIMKQIRELPSADVVEKPTWKKTEEELPKKADTYLIATSHKKIVSAFYASMNRRFNGTAGKSCTHWMEMPDGPWEK